VRRRGERVDRTADGIAAEHLLSECVRTALSAVMWRRRRWNRGPPVLLAAPDGEQHVLPLWALAAALAEVHQPSVLLGASVPPRALLDAVTQLEPTVIFLRAHTSDTARHGTLATLRRHRGLDHTTLVLGGPGWPRRTPGQVGDLAAAVQAPDPHFPFGANRGCDPISRRDPPSFLLGAGEPGGVTPRPRSRDGHRPDRGHARHLRRLLGHQDRVVTSLAHPVGANVPTVSQHLATCASPGCSPGGAPAAPASTGSRTRQ